MTAKDWVQLAFGVLKGLRQRRHAPALADAADAFYTGWDSTYPEAQRETSRVVQELREPR